MIDPKINLRVSRETPLEIYELGSELTAVGLGFPQYTNDDIVIPGLGAAGLFAGRRQGVCDCGLLGNRGAGAERRHY